MLNDLWFLFENLKKSNKIRVAAMNDGTQCKGLKTMLDLQKYVILLNTFDNDIESNNESRFAPKTMKNAATYRSIDMGSEGC